jgi:putative secretion ATPase (PEP-CTERM system associated)
MYEQAFGLTARPFQLTPDPDFFFSSRGHSRARAFLEYGLHQKEGFIVITGEIGAGKTTLIRGLLRSIEQQHIAAAQIVTTQVDADDLLRLVAQAFGLNTTGQDKAAILAGLEAFLVGLHREQRRALLVIDEAQSLTPRAVEELRMLSNFQVGSEALIQSFLVGQPEFRHIMQRPEMQQLKQRVIASYHLGPLDRPEVRPYIEHRLRHAGWTGIPAIEEQAFDRIFAFTGGVPRRINSLCDRLLLDCYLEERTTISALNTESVTAELSGELGLQDVRAPVQQATHANTLPSPAADAPYAGNVVPLHDVEADRLPSRYDVLEARIRRLEATQEMLQRLVGRMARALPMQVPGQQAGRDQE